MPEIELNDWFVDGKVGGLLGYHDGKILFSC